MKLMRRAAVAVSAAAAMVLGTMSAADAAPATAGIAAFTYAGTWEVNSTQRWSDTAGSTASVAVTAGTGGSRFDLRGFRALNHGYAGVSVDGGPETRVNYYGTRGDGVRWSTTLAAGAHTIKVRVLGTRDPRSSGTLVNVTGAYLSNGSFGAATTPTPTPAPTPAPVTPPTFEENFDRAAPLGSFRSVYSNWGHYDGTAPGDTSRRGTYDTARTTSVADGIFRQRLHHATDPQGRAHHYVSAVLPPIAGGGTDAWSGQLYGTFETRVRVTDPSGTYKMAWLLWPNTDDWADGEIDWPEADNLAAGTRPRPASKQLGNYNSVFHPATTQYAPVAIADGQWHVYRTVWSPTSIQFWQDDTLVATVTDPAFIPRVPMRWVLQSETNIGGSLSTTDPAVIEADYVRYRAR